VEFVNFEEAKKRLGKTDEQLQDLIKKGEIRAFRDEGTWKFRREDIDALAGPAPPKVAPGDSPRRAAEEGPLQLAGEGGETEAGDTLMSIDADILFAEEEEMPADSAAETWIAADTESMFPGSEEPGQEAVLGVEEALTAPEAEPAPLALSPETEESSLQEVLSDDELGGAAAPAATPGVFAEEPVIAVDAESGLASVISTASGSGSAVGPSRTRVVTLVEPTPHHGGFTLLMLVSVAALAVTAIVLMALVLGNRPGFIERIGEGNTGPIVIGVGTVLVVLIAMIAWVVEKQRVRREALGG
jgi:hypothetical protein